MGGAETPPPPTATHHRGNSAGGGSGESGSGRDGAPNAWLGSQLPAASLGKPLLPHAQL